MKTDLDTEVWWFSGLGELRRGRFSDYQEAQEFAQMISRQKRGGLWKIYYKRQLCEDFENGIRHVVNAKAMPAYMADIASAKS